jgi:hypothetical protein
MLIEVNQMNRYGYFISLYDGDKWRHNNQINRLLRGRTGYTYRDIVLMNNGCIDNDHDEEEYFFKNENDAIRVKKSLEILLGL